MVVLTLHSGTPSFPIRITFDPLTAVRFRSHPYQHDQQPQPPVVSPPRQLSASNSVVPRESITPTAVAMGYPPHVREQSLPPLQSSAVHSSAVTTPPSVPALQPQSSQQHTQIQHPQYPPTQVVETEQLPYSMQPIAGGVQAQAQKRTSPQQPPGMAGYPPLYYPVQQQTHPDPNTAHQIPNQEHSTKGSPFKFPHEAPKPGPKTKGRGSSSKKSTPKLPKQSTLPPNALADPAAAAYYQHIQAYQAAAIAQTMMNGGGGGGGSAVGAGQYPPGAVGGYSYGMDVYQHMGMYSQQHAAAAQYGYNGWPAGAGYYGTTLNIAILDMPRINRRDIFRHEPLPPPSSRRSTQSTSTPLGWRSRRDHGPAGNGRGSCCIQRNDDGRGRAEQWCLRPGTGLWRPSSNPSYTGIPSRRQWRSRWVPDDRE